MAMPLPFFLRKREAEEKSNKRIDDACYGPDKYYNITPNSSNY